jgi:hypothetical protein
MAAWTVDAEGFVECPECGEKKRAGAAGFGNIQRNHVGSKICRDTAAKRKKGENKMKNTSLLGFFQRGRPKPVPSTVTSSPVSQITSLPLPLSLESPSVVEAQPPKQTMHAGSGFLHQLEQISNTLPSTIPEATPTDLLAQFSNPAAYDNPDISSDDLWEEVLNSFLKGALGWGNDIDMATVIRRGRLGFAGVVEFVRYFTETRGVNEALFEGKLTNLVEHAMKIMLVSIYHCKKTFTYTSRIAERLNHTIPARNDTSHPQLYTNLSTSTKLKMPSNSWTLATPMPSESIIDSLLSKAHLQAARALS